AAQLVLRRASREVAVHEAVARVLRLDDPLAEEDVAAHALPRGRRLSGEVYEGLLRFFAIHDAPSLSYILRLHCSCRGRDFEGLNASSIGEDSSAVLSRTWADRSRARDPQDRRLPIAEACSTRARFRRA